VLEGHELDEAHLEAPLAGQTREVHDFVLVASAHENGVDAKRKQTGRLGSIEPGHHPAVEVPSRHRPEGRGIKGIEAHVDALEPRPGQRPGQAGELGAVGGEGEVVEARQRGDQLHQPRQVLAQERLAPRDADLADARLDGEAGNPRQLLEGEQTLPRQPLDVLVRDAVEAAEIAAVGDRDAQVLDAAPEAILERTAQERGGVHDAARVAEAGSLPGVDEGRPRTDSRLVGE
jgi:hypothetical protein